MPEKSHFIFQESAELHECVHKHDTSLSKNRKRKTTSHKQQDLHERVCNAFLNEKT